MTDVINQLIKWQTDAGSNGRDKTQIVRHVGYALEECAEMMDALQSPYVELVHDFADDYKRFTANSPEPASVDKIKQLADGFADLAVFAIAGLMRCGVDPIRALQTVADSNETKRMADGSFLRNEHGKIMKPPHYREPDWSWVK